VHDVKIYDGIRLDYYECGGSPVYIHCASHIPNIKVAGLALTESQVTTSGDHIM
jgi:hypothetical protein